MGVLRINQALLNDFDFKVNYKRVQRLMKELVIQENGSHKKICKYDSSKGPEGTRVKNKLRRRFQTDRPNQKMVSNVTEFKVPQTQERVYFEPIMDDSYLCHYGRQPKT